MAVITIDGIRLEVPEGKNVLECALDAGIYIPHLCHHKDLLPLGSCRMCIVEVEGEDKPVPSCKLEAKDGLVISTQTEEVKRLRMLALELLLAGHPEDCSTCPKYGNCELQMLIQYIGPKTGRLKMRSKGFAADDSNPLILHDMNRCVLCGRCVRACGDLRGVNVLQYQKREDLEVYTGTLHQKLLKDAKEMIKMIRAHYEKIGLGVIERFHLEMVSVEEMHRMTSGDVLGLASSNGRRYYIHVLENLSHTAMVGILAHEILHIWQFQRRLNAPNRISEGFCDLGSYEIYSQIKTQHSEVKIQMLQEDPSPIYGDGYRIVKRYFDKAGWAGVIKKMEGYLSE